MTDSRDRVVPVFGPTALFFDVEGDPVSFDKGEALRWVGGEATPVSAGSAARGVHISEARFRAMVVESASGHGLRRGTQLLTPAILVWLASLIERVPEIDSVWLFGSRANAHAREGSDWDFMVFARRGARASLARLPELHRSDVDFLVIEDGLRGNRAWGEDKKADLSGWNWKPVKNDEASYLSAKWIPDEDPTEAERGGGILERKVRRALLVWKREGT